MKGGAVLRRDDRAPKRNEAKSRGVKCETRTSVIRIVYVATRFQWRALLSSGGDLAGQGDSVIGTIDEI